MGGMFWLHPLLGIRDVDAYAYLIGARSLQSTGAYRSLSGEALNHWPPGYSFLLSAFPEPYTAALWVNYLSVGLSVAFLYLLLRRANWERVSALGLTVSLASGFFRLLADIVHADIFTYAVFLIGLWIAGLPGEPRWIPALLWAAMIPVKLIAIVFPPAASLADLWRRSWDGKKWIRDHFVAGFLSIAAVVGVSYFNFRSIGSWISASHQAMTWSGLGDALVVFVSSIGRRFLFDWHGSIREGIGAALFAICTILALASFTFLRREDQGQWLRRFGISCLLLSGLLLLVRSYEPSTRLVGYGLLAIIAGFRPLERSRWLWASYGVFSLIAAISNARATPGLGSADPSFAELARQAAPHCIPGTVLASNSFHILDIHTGIASVPVDKNEIPPQYKQYLWVNLHNPDPGTTIVTPLPRPPAGQWCNPISLRGGELFERCPSAPQDTNGMRR